MFKRNHQSPIKGLYGAQSKADVVAAILATIVTAVFVTLFVALMVTGIRFLWNAASPTEADCAKHRPPVLTTI